MSEKLFSGKKITVGITGGIAAYKAADIVSWLNQQGAEVTVAMTKSACEFITPLTMKTLSGRPVACDINSLDADFHVPHIDIASCDLFLVVPATANIIAKAACGIADELVSAALLATSAPIIFAPAMHCDMYANPATQANIKTLSARGCRFIEPGEGRLACGAIGRGRLAKVEDIKQYITDFFAEGRLLSGRRVLVTAGPTYEYIDPVRFIGNRSSGKMGYAVAAAAVEAGAEVLLVSGPCSLPVPAGVKCVRVTSAAEMEAAVREAYAEYDIVVMAAAVADYRPEQQAEQKIKKGGGMEIKLVANNDILKGLGADKGDHILVGFAAETQNLAAYATKKLVEKNLDLIIANNVAQAGAGFDGDTNIITAISPDKTEEWEMMSKRAAGRQIIKAISELPRF